MSDLVIVESPAKAKTISQYLGKGYKVMASMGHLRDLPKSQFGVDVEHDFEPKYISIRGKGELIAKLRKEAKASKRVYLATDPDREGEAISWHLAQLLDLPEDQSSRVTFNEITKTAVKAGIKAPRSIDIDLVNAQQTRRILDRIVGYKLSPILWKKVKKGLSAGRVQSVATRLIVDREREIESFVPREYWNLTARYHGTNAKKCFNARFYGKKGKKTELKSADQVNHVLSALQGCAHVVSALKKGEKQRSPAPPFITSTLQQEAARRMNFQARRTMSVAQELYEGIDIKGVGFTGLITYMRTDSLRIAAEAQAAARSYITSQIGPEFCPETPRIYKSRKNVQDAHEAIRPAHIELLPETIKESLSHDQYRLYKLIWDRFVASQMANARYDTVSVDISAGDYTFKVNGQTLRFKGFTALYEESRDEKEEDEVQPNLPVLAVGDVLSLKELMPEQKFTQPPSRYTEATLIRTLEENGIGRPSTYAPTITTILARGYVVREGRQLKPTPLGEVTCDLLIEHFKDIVDVDFTAHMEEELDNIEAGKEDWKQMLHTFYNGFSTTLSVAEEKLGGVHFKVEDQVSDVVCDKCGRLMVYKMGRFGKFLACPGFPECRNTKAITVTTDIACPKCGANLVLRKTKSGTKYYGCEKYPECDFRSWDEPLKEKCPKCGGTLYRRTKWKKGVYCANKECGYERSDK